MFCLGKREYYLVKKEEYDYSKVSEFLVENEKVLEVFTNDEADLVFTTSRIISVYSPFENCVDWTFISYNKILYISLIQGEESQVAKVVLTIFQGKDISIVVETFEQAKKLSERIFGL